MMPFINQWKKKARKPAVNPADSCYRGAIEASKQWIGAVTGCQTLDSDFITLIQDGLLLCTLIQKVTNRSAGRINKLPTPLAWLDNGNLFLNECHNYGVKEQHIFDIDDFRFGGKLTDRLLQSRDGRRKLRHVLLTIFWLGKEVEDRGEFQGPLLYFEAFNPLLISRSTDSLSVAAPKMVKQDSPAGSSRHSSLREKKHVSFEDHPSPPKGNSGKLLHQNERESPGMPRKQTKPAAKATEEQNAKPREQPEMYRTGPGQVGIASSRDREHTAVRNEKVALVHPYMKNGDERNGDSEPYSSGKESGRGPMKTNSILISDQKSKEGKPQGTITVIRQSPEEKSNFISSVNVKNLKSSSSLPDRGSTQESTDVYSTIISERRDEGPKQNLKVDHTSDGDYYQIKRSHVADLKDGEQNLSTVDRIARLRQTEAKRKANSLPVEHRSVRGSSEPPRSGRQKAEPSSHRHRDSKTLEKVVDATGGDSRRRYSAESYKSYKKRQSAERRRAEVREIIRTLNKQENEGGNHEKEDEPPSSRRHTFGAQNYQERKYETVDGIKSQVEFHRRRQNRDDPIYPGSRVSVHVSRADIRKEHLRGRSHVPFQERVNDSSSARRVESEPGRRQERVDASHVRRSNSTDRGSKDTAKYPENQEDSQYLSSHPRRTRDQTQHLVRQGDQRSYPGTEGREGQPGLGGERGQKSRDHLSRGNISMAEALGLPEDVVELVKEEEKFWKRQAELRKWRESQEKRLDELEMERKKSMRDEAKERRIEELRREHQVRKSQGKLRRIGGYDQIYVSKHGAAPMYSLANGHIHRTEKVVTRQEKEPPEPHEPQKLTKSSRSLTQEELRSAEEELLAQQAERLVKFGQNKRESQGHGLEREAPQGDAVDGMRPSHWEDRNGHVKVDQRPTYSHEDQYRKQYETETRHNQVRISDYDDRRSNKRNSASGYADSNIAVYGNHFESDGRYGNRHGSRRYDDDQKRRSNETTVSYHNSAINSKNNERSTDRHGDYYSESDLRYGRLSLEASERNQLTQYSDNEGVSSNQSGGDGHHRKSHSLPGRYISNNDADHAKSRKYDDSNKKTVDSTTSQVKFDSDRERQYALLMMRLSTGTDEESERVEPSYISEEHSEIDVAAGERDLNARERTDEQTRNLDTGYASTGSEAARQRSRDSVIMDMHSKSRPGFFSDDDDVFLGDRGSDQGRDYFSDPEILRGDMLRVSNPWKLREAKPVSIRQAYMLRCCACGCTINDDNLMNVEGKKLFWHRGCFICVVCKTRLSAMLSNRLKVRIIEYRLHCGKCYTSNGDQLTEV